MSARARGRMGNAFRSSLKVLVALVGVGLAVYAVAFALGGSGIESLFRSSWFWFVGLLFVFLVSLLFSSRLSFLARGGSLGRLPPHDLADGVKEVLRQRFARGEIDKDQFDQMMRDLDQRP
jgi:uncharacterized membrane protein